IGFFGPVGAGWRTGGPSGLVSALTSAKDGWPRNCERYGAASTPTPRAAPTTNRAIRAPFHQPPPALRRRGATARPTRLPLVRGSAARGGATAAVAGTARGMAATAVRAATAAERRWAWKIRPQCLHFID